MMAAVTGLCWAGGGWGGRAILSMETLDPSILGGGALTGPAGGGILTLGVPGLAGLIDLMGCLGVPGLTPLTPGEAPLGAGGGVPLGAAGDLMAAGDLGAGDLMDLPTILTAGLATALGCEKDLVRPGLAGCLCLSSSPSSQSGLLMVTSGSVLHTRQLQLPVAASLM